MHIPVAPCPPCNSPVEAQQGTDSSSITSELLLTGRCTPCGELARVHRSHSLIISPVLGTGLFPKADKRISVTQFKILSIYKKKKDLWSLPFFLYSEELALAFFYTQPTTKYRTVQDFIYLCLQDSSVFLNAKCR